MWGAVGAEAPPGAPALDEGVQLPPHTKGPQECKCGLPVSPTWVLLKRSRTLWSLPPMSSACLLSVEKL